MSEAPTQIKLHQVSRVLEVHFGDDAFMLPCEYLRVHSPSAEVQGHGPGQAVLQLDKESVNIVAIEPVGHYAVRLVFDDGHNSGLFTWDTLYDLGVNRKQYWQTYLASLAAVAKLRISQDSDKYLL
ncbi:MAG: DUF971 domain-containing protein [Pseudomonadota bacterium]